MLKQFRNSFLKRYSLVKNCLHKVVAYFFKLEGGIKDIAVLRSLFIGIIASDIGDKLKNTCP